jgi:hypothetical protein
MENKRKHLEFIQAAINRMANNSFLLKGWAITLAGGLFALSFKEVDRRYLYVSLAVLSLFWLLDGYYLSRERNFVKLYNSVRIIKEEKEIDFLMDPKKFAKWWGWPKCTLSITLLLLYGGLLAVILLINHYL